MKIFRSGRRLPVVQIFIKICLFLRTESNGNLFDWELWLALLQLLWVVMILCWSPGEPRWQHQPTGHYSFSDRHCCYFSSPAQLVPSHCSTWVAISCNISISYKQIINIPLLHLPFPPSPPSLSPALVRSDPWRESTNWRICHDSDHNPGHWEERRLLSMFLSYWIMSSNHLFMELEIKLKEWRVHLSDDDTFNASPPPSPFLCDEHFKQTRESLQLTNIRPLQPRLSCVNDTAGYWLSMVVWPHKASKHHPDFFSLSQDQLHFSGEATLSYWEWGIAPDQKEDSIFL